MRSRSLHSSNYFDFVTGYEVKTWLNYVILACMVANNRAVFKNFPAPPRSSHGVRKRSSFDTSLKTRGAFPN